MTAGSGIVHSERVIYLLTGGISIVGEHFNPGEMLILKPGIEIEIEATTATHLVLIGGAKIDSSRIKWWNFVSSSRDRLNRAKEDWQEKRFPLIPGDEEEFIPLPKQTAVG